MVRGGVRELLTSNGLTVEQTQQRINALTDKEAQQRAEKFDEQPADGVLIALLIVILEFIILELAGVTEIFTGI